MSPSETAWPIIQELANFAREVGDTKKEGEWVENYAWNRLGLRSNAIKKDLGAFYERIDKVTEAEQLLREVYISNPADAYCILPLIKTLCRRNKIKEAKCILDKSQSNAYPKEVYTYAKIFYSKSISNFPEAELLFTQLSHSIHYYGQWSDLYLSWCLALQGDERVITAKKGLKFVEKIMEVGNVPAMIACHQLADIAGEQKLKSDIENSIRQINDDYFQS